jgi:hypothetical protein
MTLVVIIVCEFIWAMWCDEGVASPAFYFTVALLMPFAICYLMG